jgi:hypothetical protein
MLHPLSLGLVRNTALAVAAAALVACSAKTETETEEDDLTTAQLAVPAGDTAEDDDLDTAQDDDLDTAEDDDLDTAEDDLDTAEDDEVDTAEDDEDDDLDTAEDDEDDDLDTAEDDDLDTAEHDDAAALALTLDPPVPMPGQPMTVTVSGAAPNQPVFLLTSPRAAPLAGPCPTILGGLCLDLQAPQLLGQLTADGAGNATLSGRLPPNFSTLWLQAVQVAAPGVSDSAELAMP